MDSKTSCSVQTNDEIVDIFNGVQLKWRFLSRPAPREVVRNPDHYKVKDNNKFFELRFHKKHKQMVLHAYIPHALNIYKEMSKQKKTLKLFTLKDRMHAGKDVWRWANLDHPATFNTLAMDSDKKQMIIDDLERFVKKKDFYRNVGKAWKRGYLLYGPPGTGNPA